MYQVIIKRFSVYTGQLGIWVIYQNGLDIDNLIHKRALLAPEYNFTFFNAFPIQ